MKAGLFLNGKLLQEFDSFAEAKDYKERVYNNIIDIIISPIWYD